MTLEWQIPPGEREYLRQLAAKQAEQSALPVMEQRRRMWFALNDGQTGARPPVIIETGTFKREFLPEGTLRCSSDTGRSIERQLQGNLRNFELINDDKVMPDTFDIPWFTEIDEFGVKVEMRQVQNAEGVESGYEYLHPIHDLDRDFGLLKPATCRVDRVKTHAWKKFLEDLFGDLLPVRIRSGVYGNTFLTQRVIVLMGMEAFFLAMYDNPEGVHRLMAYLRDNALKVMRWAEEEKLLCANNGNQQSFYSSFNFNHRLEVEGTARLSDMWGAANSQETVGISPTQFREFCAPYYRAVCEPMGLLYYGCCEPAHPFWEDIRRMPHLKKVSINRWTDQRFMGEALRGSDIVFSRKPDPNFLGVDETLREEAWASHIRETLEATRGVLAEFIVRDVYTVHGNLGNARRAVEIARREVDRFFGA